MNRQPERAPCPVSSGLDGVGNARPRIPDFLPLRVEAEAARARVEAGPGPRRAAADRIAKDSRDT
jgi:hypothetical protein